MPVKQKIGRVVSDKMQKTVAVLVETRAQHPRYKRFINKRAKFYAHDEKSEAKMGDLVKIMECRPISKLKRWRVEEILEKAR